MSGNGRSLAASETLNLGARVKDQTPPRSPTSPSKADARDFHLCNQLLLHHVDYSSSWVIRGLRWAPQVFHYCCPLESNHSSLWHEHDVFELNLLCQGSLNFQTTDHTVKIRAGDVYYMSPGLRHQWSMVSAPVSIAGFHFRVSALNQSGSELLDSLKQRAAKGQFALGKNAPHTQIHRAIWEALHRLPRCPLLAEKLNTLFQLFVEEFLELAVPGDVLAPPVTISTLTPETVAVSKYQQIVDYVNQNIYKPLHLEDIAQHFNYSVRHVSRLFQKESGMSLGLFILERKLQIAQRLLATTDYPVKTIALELGYNDVGYFCRLFRTHLQGTPNKFRMQILAGRTARPEGPSGHHSFRGNYQRPAGSPSAAA